MKTKNILIPFVGFYESVASNKAESIAFGNFINQESIPARDTVLDIPDDLTEAEQEQFWDEYYPEHIEEIRKQIAVDYITHLSAELNLPMEFESISSPRYYNYTTDRLFVTVPEAELLHFYNRVDKKILAEMIKERHTSGPGFTSYYDNDIEAESWKDPEAYDHNQWETVIEAYIKENDINVDDIYWI